MGPSAAFGRTPGVATMPSCPAPERSRPPRRRDGAVVAGSCSRRTCSSLSPVGRTFGFDAYAYWRLDPANRYRETAGALGAFTLTHTPSSPGRSPRSALLAFWQFLSLWMAALAATVVWLGGARPRPVLALLAFPPVALELYHGNVHLLMAAAIALGFRFPWTWSFVLLTKVTPGVGLAWFLVRREWRSLAVALGVTAAIAVVSLAVDPEAWRSWIADSLGATAAGAPLNQLSIPIPLWIRVPVALLVVAWGARTDRRWNRARAATGAARPVAQWPRVLAAVVPCSRPPGAPRRHPVVAMGPLRLRPTFPAGTLDALLAAWFAVISAQRLVVLAGGGAFGFDGRLYREAARAWLAGGDPWSVALGGIVFGAPPPTLLAMARSQSSGTGGRRRPGRTRGSPARPSFFATWACRYGFLLFSALVAQPGTRIPSPPAAFSWPSCRWPGRPVKAYASCLFRPGRWRPLAFAAVVLLLTPRCCPGVSFWRFSPRSPNASGCSHRVG